MDQFTNLFAKRTRDLEQKEKSLDSSQIEVSRLATEVVELKSQMKEKDE